MNTSIANSNELRIRHTSVVYQDMLTGASGVFLPEVCRQEQSTETFHSIPCPLISIIVTVTDSESV